MREEKKMSLLEEGGRERADFCLCFGDLAIKL